jgi:hypothetical protein
MKKLEFHPFKEKEGWNTFDCLGDIDLKDGQKIMLSWPDGTQEEVKVRVRIGHDTVSDMGTPFTRQLSHAWIKTDLHGASLEIRPTRVNGKLLGAFL